MSSDYSASLASLFENLATLLTSVGIPTDVSEKGFRQALEKASALPGTVEPEFGLDQGARQFLTQLISAWRREPDYTDTEGNPLPLPKAGEPPSIHGLFDMVRDRVPEFQLQMTIDEAFDRLLSHSVILPAADATYSLNIDYFPVNTSSSTSAESQLDFVAQFLRTSTYNVLRPGLTGRFQRRSSVATFPKAELALLQSMLNEQGMDLLRVIDDFLEERAQATSAVAGEDSCLVGFGMYMYVKDDDEPPPG